MSTQARTDDGKAGFDHIYNQPDPRDYYRVLGALDYEIPERARPTFRTLLAAAGNAPATVLDVCCSYGVNAALMRCDLQLDDVFDHYRDPALDGLDPESLRAADRAFYGGRRRPDAPRVLGLDLAPRAVGYAKDIGLLADGWSENLENDDPSDGLRAGIAEVDLVTITGGVGYVTERTFDRLLSVFPAGRKPSVAAFVLRRYSVEAITGALAAHGLHRVDTGAATYPQRRFADDTEREATVRALEQLGIDPTGKEADGRYHADLFVFAPPT